MPMKRRRCRIVVEELQEDAAAAPVVSATPVALDLPDSAASLARASAPDAASHSALKTSAPAQEPAPAPAPAPAISARQAAIDAAREKRVAAQAKKAEWEARKNKKRSGAKRARTVKSDVLARAMAEMVFPEDAEPGLSKEMGLGGMGVEHGILQSMQLPTVKTRTKPGKKRP